jgi:uncharacterized protein YjdB
MKKRSRHLSGLTLFALTASMLLSCGEDTVEPTSPTLASVVVAPSADTLISIGDTLQLSAVARDGSGAVMSGKTFTWSSSDETVATVSASGLVTAVANGMAQIAAIADGVGGTSDVTVAQEAASVAISPIGASISGVGETQQFGLEAWDAGGRLIPDPSATWRSLNTNVARIDANGIATAVGSGQVTMHAELNGLEAHVVMTVSVPGVA